MIMIAAGTSEAWEKDERVLLGTMERALSTSVDKQSFANVSWFFYTCQILLCDSCMFEC